MTSVKVIACPKCGAPLPEGAEGDVRCTYCGHRLNVRTGSYPRFQHGKVRKSDGNDPSDDGNAVLLGITLLPMLLSFLRNGLRTTVRYLLLILLISWLILKLWS